MSFTCPHCGSWDCGRTMTKIIENWESDVDIIWYQRCQCDECGKEFWEKTTYVCDQTRVALTDAEFEAIREESMKDSKLCWSE